MDESDCHILYLTPKRKDSAFKLSPKGMPLENNTQMKCLILIYSKTCLKRSLIIPILGTNFKEEGTRSSGSVVEYLTWVSGSILTRGLCKNVSLSKIYMLSSAEA